VEVINFLLNRDNRPSARLLQGARAKASLTLLLFHAKHHHLPPPPPPPSKPTGDDGEKAGLVGLYAGELGENAGLDGLYAGEEGE